MSGPTDRIDVSKARLSRGIAAWFLLFCCHFAFANADIAGLGELRALGVSWASDERSGLTWTLHDVKGPRFTARTADLTLDTPPELVLSDVVVKLGARAGVPATRRLTVTQPDEDEDDDETEPTAAPPAAVPIPAWLVNVTLNNVSLVVRGRELLSGVNASLSDGQLKVRGPVVSAEGTLDLGAGTLSAVGAVTHEHLSARVEIDAIRGATWPLSVRLRQIRLKGKMVGDEALRLDGTDIYVGRRQGQWTGYAELAAMRVSFGARCQSTCGVYAALDKTELQDVLSQMNELRRMTAGAAVSGQLSAEAWYVGGQLDLSADLSAFSVRGTDVNFEQYRYGLFQYPVWLRDATPAVRTSGEGTSDWLSLVEIGPMMPAAVKSAEDLRFDRHRGFDVPATLEVVKDVVNKGRRWRGGSTITQQLVKNLMLNPRERSVQRKLDEWLIAAELDRELGKERVMELYLNIVEWGPGLRGIGSASRYYLDKEPADLSPIEAAWLATALPSPKRFHQAWQQGRERGAARVNWILRNMSRIGAISEAEFETARLAKFPSSCEHTGSPCIRN